MQEDPPCELRMSPVGKPWLEHVVPEAEREPTPRPAGSRRGDQAPGPPRAPSLQVSAAALGFCGHRDRRLQRREHTLSRLRSQAWGASRLSRLWGSFLPPPVSGGGRCPLACGCVIPGSASILTKLSPRVCVPSEREGGHSLKSFL